jgi:hypothetical protein
VNGSAAVEQIYRQFAAYSCPASAWVCEQCGPEFSPEDIRATPLRSLSLPQLGAVHVMSLDDDALRYFFPRLMELMLTTPAPVFDFRMSDLKRRFPGWRPEESTAVRRLAGAVWSELLAHYPAVLGYFSDCPTALELLDWCALSVPEYLDMSRTGDSLAAAMHLADLIDAVFTTTDPFESVSRTTVVDWLTASATGQRLERAFFTTDSPEAALRLSTAHELWTVCCR